MQHTAGAIEYMVHTGVSANAETGCFLAPSPSSTLFDIDPRQVYLNRCYWFGARGIDLSQTNWLQQKHENQIVIIRPDQVGMGHDPRGVNTIVGDAMITDVPGAVLVMKGADCPTVLLWSPYDQTVAAIHMGRAGQQAALIYQVMMRMTADFSVDPQSVHAFVGPMISAQYYQFNAQRDSRVVDWYHNMGAVEYIKGQPHLDMATVIGRQLENAGIAPDRVTWDGRCTYATSGLWSHRRAFHETGNGFNRDNNLAWIRCPG